MRTRPQIAIIGAGNLACALASALHRAGYEIELVVGRSRALSQKRACRLAEEVGSRAANSLPESLHARLIWICVPDSAIARVAESLVRQIDWKGRLVFHSSGALTSDVLKPLRRRGAAVASVHPLMTFVSGSRPPLAGVPFALEGDPAALREARQIVRDLGGRPYPIRKEHKAAYHAWGTFVSPLFTALLATAEQVAKKAGVSSRAARQRAIPILLQTLANYATFGAAGAFSGPIVRGDVDTVKQHLRTLRDVPMLEDAYRSLAFAAIRYLPGKNKVGMGKALRESAASSK